MKRFASTAGLLLLGCRPTAPVPPPPPSPRPVDASARTDAPLTSSEAGITASPPAAPAVDWGAAWVSLPLDETEVSSWLNGTQSPVSLTATHAAFVLGRRVPTVRLPAVLSQLPPSLRDAFARGAAGRMTELQRGSFPTAFGDFAAMSHADVTLATWVFRSRAEVPGLTEGALRRFFASERFDDQVGGARLLAAPNVAPAYDLVDYLQPTAATLAFRATATRPATALPAPPWRRWIEATALKVRANPRAWGSTWLALVESAPKTVPEVRAALLPALVSLSDVDLGDARPTVEFRCANAVTRDLLSGAVDAVNTCAPETHRWRSLVALARYAKEGVLSRDRLLALQAAWRGANGDARVLESVAEALVEFTPAISRPMLLELAASRDPGVLAAVLDALALHVQHARALPNPVRERLLRAPLELDEAPSLEARLNAIQLARALGTALPTSTTNVRAVRQALQPDAQVNTALTVPETALDEGDLVITTTLGRVVVRIDGRSARQAARVVIEAARSGRYNGTVFHRIVPAFVAQGGDPRGDGYGGTSTIVPTELSGERFERGAVGIALAGLDTGGMQFFIVTADSPHLDARYPWIGRVVEGMEVVDELMIGDAMQRVEFVAR